MGQNLSILSETRNLANRPEFNKNENEYYNPYCTPTLAKRCKYLCII